MFCLFVVYEYQPEILWTFGFEKRVNVNCSKGLEGISDEESYFDGATMSFVEAVDGEGEGISGFVIFFDGRDLFCLEVLIGYADFKVGLG